MSQFTTKENLDMDDLGFYPIGTECSKLMAEHGVPVYDLSNNEV